LVDVKKEYTVIAEIRTSKR